MSVIIIMVNRCEDVELALPGNNQDSKQVPPIGAINWSPTINVLSDKAQLPENSASGLTLGTLNATDENPDDEFSYQIKSQSIEGSSVSYFILSSDSGNVNLVLNTNSINYEALSGSKEIDLIIAVTDDSPEPQTSDFSFKIEVTNVNESPYFSNLNSITPYADVEVGYEFDKVEWSDIDEGQNPTLTSQGPGWLTISNEGQMSGTPVVNDIGINSFTLTITDGEISVQEEVNIEVRENSAPVFSNTNSIPTLIRVGCYDDNDNLVDINWYDPNNNSPYFAGNDIVTFTHQGTESIEWLNFDNEENGILFCVRAPENGDAGTSIIDLTLGDNRPNIPLTTEYSFELTLSANDAPEYDNLSSFPETVAAGDTLNFDVNWQDPQEDQINFIVTESLSWFTWEGSGIIVAVPSSNDIGDYNLIFRISDGCYEVSSERTLTVQ